MTQAIIVDARAPTATPQNSLMKMLLNVIGQLRLAQRINETILHQLLKILTFGVPSKQRGVRAAVMIIIQSQVVRFTLKLSKIF